MKFTVYVGKDGRMTVPKAASPMETFEEVEKAEVRVSRRKLFGA